MEQISFNNIILENVDCLKQQMKHLNRILGNMNNTLKKY